MRIGSLVRLFAIEEPWLVALQRDIKWMDVGDIIRVKVAEVGVKLSTWDLGTWSVEAGFSEGVVDGAEVEVDALALADTADVRGVEDELLIWTDKD